MKRSEATEVQKERAKFLLAQIASKLLANESKQPVAIPPLDLSLVKRWSSQEGIGKLSPQSDRGGTPGRSKSTSVLASNPGVGVSDADRMLLIERLKTPTPQAPRRNLHKRNPSELQPKEPEGAK